MIIKFYTQWYYTCIYSFECWGFSNFKTDYDNDEGDVMITMIDVQIIIIIILENVNR